MSQAMEVQKASGIAEQLRAVRPYLERLLPDPARFGATLMVVARRNPQILRCDPSTIVGAALVCAQLELEPGPAEHVWLIPRRNKHTGTIDCTLLLGYKGMKALTERHPAIASLRTGTVHENDEYEYTAQPPSLRHTPKLESERGAPRFWYAIATRHDSDAPHITVLTRADVEARRAKSASPNEGPWKTHYDAMARKSAIRALWKELPSSLDMQRAAVIDDSEGAVRPRELGVPAPPDPDESPKNVDPETGEICEELEAIDESNGQLFDDQDAWE